MPAMNPALEAALMRRAQLTGNLPQYQARQRALAAAQQVPLPGDAGYDAWKRQFVTAPPVTPPPASPVAPVVATPPPGMLPPAFTGGWSDAAFDSSLAVAQQPSTVATNAPPAVPAPSLQTGMLNTQASQPGMLNTPPPNPYSQMSGPWAGRLQARNAAATPGAGQGMLGMAAGGMPVDQMVAARQQAAQQFLPENGHFGVKGFAFGGAASPTQNPFVQALQQAQMDAQMQQAPSPQGNGLLNQGGGGNMLQQAQYQQMLNSMQQGEMSDEQRAALLKAMMQRRQMAGLGGLANALGT